MRTKDLKMTNMKTVGAIRMIIALSVCLPCVVQAAAGEPQQMPKSNGTANEGVPSLQPRRMLERRDRMSAKGTNVYTPPCWRRQQT
jgi:hypothetical protein